MLTLKELLQKEGGRFNDPFIQERPFVGMSRVVQVGSPCTTLEGKPGKVVVSLVEGRSSFTRNPRAITILLNCGDCITRESE